MMPALEVRIEFLISPLAQASWLGILFIENILPREYFMPSENDNK